MDESMSKKELVSRFMAKELLAQVNVEVGQTVELDDGRKVLITKSDGPDVTGVELDPEYTRTTGVEDSVCDEEVNNLRAAFLAPAAYSTEIISDNLDSEHPVIVLGRGCSVGKTGDIVPPEVPVSDAPIKPLSADEILAADPETAQDIIDWQDATYLLIGAMMLSQGKLAAHITVAQLEKFRQKYQLQFTKGKDGSLNYRVRQKPKNPGAKNV